MSSAKPSVVIIGAGALGTVLAQRLAEGGYLILAVFSRTQASARRLAGRVGARVASTSLADLPAEARLLFCCVPDDAIADVADQLSQLPHDWPHCTVAHTSGALTTGILAPLTEQGATTLSFHPMQTFTPASSPAIFENIYVGLEGTERAVQLGAQLAHDLGAHHIVIAPEAKAHYHLAASMASNFLVTLVTLVEEVLADAGIPPHEGAALIQPLLQQTCTNLTHQRPEDALTGPIVRGDEATVADHVHTLAADFPHLIPVYTALATETVRLAVQSKRLDSVHAQRLLDVLHDALEPDQDAFY